MINFETTIHQFGSMGEKTGWSYIAIPNAVAQKLFPGNKKAFYVNGKLDALPIQHVSLLPIGDGDFIMALKADVRKKLRKQKGDSLKVQLTHDKTGYQVNTDFLECLADEPQAKAHFETLPGSHQRYFSRWIESAKTAETQAKRMALAINALARKQGYAEMIREQTAKRKQL